MARLDWVTSRPVAHRGLHDGRIVENSLQAVEAALEAGFAVEVDVQAAAGLEPVVFHDAALERLTGEVGPVAARTADQLAKIPLKGTRERIPTLRALLDLVAGRTPLIIEVKTDWSGMPEFCARIVDLLKDYPGPVAVMSFDPKAIQAFRRIAIFLPRGVVAEASNQWAPPATDAAQRLRLRHLLHFPQSRPHFIAYRVDDLPQLGPLVARRVFGLPLLAWTVHDETQRAQAQRWADQIIFEGFRP